MCSNENCVYQIEDSCEIKTSRRYDFHIGSVNAVCIKGSDKDVFSVRVGSSMIKSLGDYLSVSMEEERDSVDVNFKRNSSLSEEQALEGVCVEIVLPSLPADKIELSAKAKSVSLCCIKSEEVELDIKASRLSLNNVKAAVEVDCNQNIQICAKTLNADLSVNQLRAKSTLSIPANAAFKSVVKGIGNRIVFEKDGQEVPAFDQPEAKTIVELNGVKSTLTISKSNKD